MATAVFYRWRNGAPEEVGRAVSQDGKLYVEGDGIQLLVNSLQLEDGTDIAAIVERVSNPPYLWAELKQETN